VLENLWLRKPLVEKVVRDLAWEQATNQGWVADNFEDMARRLLDLAKNEQTLGYCPKLDLSHVLEWLIVYEWDNQRP
jgi:hypothetical protein